MMQITLFGGTFTNKSKDDVPIFYNYGNLGYIFTAKINKNQYDFYYKDYCFHLECGSIIISQRLYLNNLSKDTIQSYFQRAAKKFEKEFKKLNIEKTLKLQIFE
jgi:hypothetical protein